MIAAEFQLMTTEQFLALPEDGVDRELIEGQLREKPMTVRQLSARSLYVENRFKAVGLG